MLPTACLKQRENQEYHTLVDVLILPLIDTQQTEANSLNFFF